jgi:hypothetical protein
MDEFDMELSQAQGQRTAAWTQERLGRFTSSKFNALMTEGRGGTKQRRARLQKSLEKGEMSQTAFDAEIKDCDREDYEAKFGDTCKTYVWGRVAEMLTGAPHWTGSFKQTEWGEENEGQALQLYSQRTGNIVKPIGFVTFEDYAGGSPDGQVEVDVWKGWEGLGINEVKCPYDPANHVKAVLDKELQLAIIRIRRDEKVLDVLKARINEVREYMIKALQNNPDLESAIWSEYKK